MITDDDIFASSSPYEPLSMSSANCMDDLLAAIGYNKVRSNDGMADVPQKLDHQLQTAAMMGNNVNARQDGTSSNNVASNDAVVHYNDPNDVFNWDQTMLTNTNNQNDTTITNSMPFTQILEDPLQYHILNGNSATDFRAVTETVKPQGEPHAVLTRPSGVIEDTGVRLVHALMACAEAIQEGNLDLADVLVRHASLLASQQGGAMRKVATNFSHALARRIYGAYPNDSISMSPSLSDMLHVHFYEACPYLKFAHFTANQAILEAFSAATTVHVIDFGLKQGLQWPPLMQALALRPGGPPAFRLTGIGPTSPDNNTDTLQQVGWRLAQLARTIRVRFEFRGFTCNSLSDLDPTVLDIRPGESVAVNSVFELHRLLAKPGSLEMVLNTVKRIEPEIVTVVEQEANHNGPVFLERFTEAMHYYSSLFDSMEGSVNNEDGALVEVYLGRQICNVVACEGEERVERHETLAQWRNRMGSAGFEPVRLGSNAFRQARMLLALFAGGEGYRVEENDGCLLLGWQTRPLIATSAWRVGGGARRH
ncbi:hypothetical protein PIB30_059247 [Stylosanthes scabra]|uniref:DELLA protein n=1 Tax=Stylosanthes scabra TaxID=79078 RepID=A0ABU6VK06_9FABA|nr:hypothetical protein [Stylosanthes scabra]